MGVIADAAEADEAAANGNGTERTLNESVERMRGEYAAALPPWLGIQTFMRDARTVIARSVLEANSDKPSLLECVEKSVLASLMTCAQLGLRIGVNGEAILKPRWSTRHQGHVAVFEAGYQGLQKLAYQSGAVRKIYAQEVYQEDDFYIERGHDERLRHVPALIDDPGGLKLFYAFAKLPSGECLFEHWMDSRMVRFRAEYAPAEQYGGPWWNTLTYPAMGRKTMLKQLAKQLPITGEFAEAVAADEKVRLEIDKAARPAEVSEYEEPDRAPGESGVEAGGTSPAPEQQPAGQGDASGSVPGNRDTLSSSDGEPSTPNDQG